jgi:hypothetical protein
VNHNDHVTRLVLLKININCKPFYDSLDHMLLVSNLSITQSSDGSRDLSTLFPEETSNLHGENAPVRQPVSPCGIGELRADPMGIGPSC